MTLQRVTSNEWKVTPLIVLQKPLFSLFFSNDFISEPIYGDFKLVSYSKSDIILYSKCLNVCPKFYISFKLVGKNIWEKFICNILLMEHLFKKRYFNLENHGLFTTELMKMLFKAAPKFWSKIPRIKLARWRLIGIILNWEVSQTWEVFMWDWPIVRRSFFTDIFIQLKVALGGLGGHLNTDQGGGNLSRKNNSKQMPLC